MEQNLAAVELRERTNTKCVAMDKYATIFVLVGRYIINSCMTRGLVIVHYSVNLISYSHNNPAGYYCRLLPEPSDIILTFCISKKCLTTLTTLKVPDIS